MDALYEYIPEDRRKALALDEPLADRSWGAALFADISGFTPLAQTLVHELGHRRGAEELTHHLNAVFDSLISALHLYGGTVVGFSGDAITCWFDTDSGVRAIAGALAMQQRLKELACVELPSGKTISLAMKGAIACGPVRRFVVGNPKRQVIDVLAGKTLDHLAEAEHLAQSGELVLHPSAIPSTKDHITITAWHEHQETHQQYCVVGGLLNPEQPSPWQDIKPERIPEEMIRPWLLPPVYQRLRSGSATFLAELRPATAVFVQFHGIDYETDEEAGDKLDNFIRAVERILSDYEGSLIQLTTGDKGSYLYAAFGAPIAHEDDAARAVSAARDIQSLVESAEGITEIRIGISQGRMRTGSYGGSRRRTYGVLGDDVNLAARLMQTAQPGQILASNPVYESTSETHAWESLAEVKLKGFKASIPVFRLTEIETQQMIQLQEPTYDLPMVGRETELQSVEQDLENVARGKGRVILITGEAGVGKSRFVAEVIRLSKEKHLTVYGGACQSYGSRSNYLVWQPIFRSLFNLDPAWTPERQVEALTARLKAVDPLLPQRLPLLGNMLGISIPDNALTRSLDAKLRKASLESLLVKCLQAEALEKPLILVLEDCHWIDDMSRDLLIEMGKISTSIPLLLVLAYRPYEEEHDGRPLISEKTVALRISLSELSPSEVERLISLQLEHLYGGELEVLPSLFETITTRSEGNPFYVEELLAYLRDRGVDLQNREALEKLDLPDTLQSLILSRIDRLTENQKSSLKVASVVGRSFRAAWLWGYYSELGDPERIRGDLAEMSQIDLLSLQSTSPELIYIFKHMLTQQVTYESLPFATRAALHNQLGLFIENEYREALEPHLDLLAYHYDLSDNASKKRMYLLKAGEAAQGKYANESAMRYYERVLPLLTADEQTGVRINLGQVLELVGRWSEAEQNYQQVIDQSEHDGDRRTQADCQTIMGELQRKQGHYAEASQWLDRAQTVYQKLADDHGMGQVLHYKGTVAAHQGQYETAKDLYNQSLTIRKRLKDQPQIASLLSNMGIVARFQGDYQEARELQEQALAIRRELGDKWAIGVSLNNLGNVAIDQGNFEEARQLQEEGLAIRRTVGDRWAIANALNNLGNLAREQGEYESAASFYFESMEIIKGLEDMWATSYLLEDLGCLSALQGQPERALQLVGAAATLRETIGAPLSPAEKQKLEGALELARSAISDDQQAIAYEQGQRMSIDQAIEFALEDRSEG